MTTPAAQASYESAKASPSSDSTSNPINTYRNPNRHNGSPHRTLDLSFHTPLE